MASSESRFEEKFRRPTGRVGRYSHIRDDPLRKLVRVVVENRSQCSRRTRSFSERQYGDGISSNRTQVLSSSATTVSVLGSRWKCGLRYLGFSEWEAPETSYWKLQTIM